MTTPLLDSLRASLRNTFSGKLLTNSVDTAPYLVDARGRIRGEALAVVEPDTTADVASVVKWCAANRVPIVPQSGNTGLSGGATPDTTGRAIVLSTRRLNRIRAIDPVNNTMTVEAGVILENVQTAADEAGRLFPLSLASQGSCTIGGNLSTNAGGVHVLRYGNARELCLGLEVVTAAGEIWDGLRSLRKDNTGYDLRDLFVGAEGTLGIITAAVMKLSPKPAAQSLAWCAVASPEHAQQLLTLAQAKLGAGLTAFELISDVALTLVLKHFVDARNPLPVPSPWYVLMEVVSSIDQASCDDALQATLAEASEEGYLQDAALSASQADIQKFWALRENISESQSREGKNIKHDIAVPVSQVAKFIEEMRKVLIAKFGDISFVTFGHMGDGNLHYNVGPSQYGRTTDQNEAFLANQNAINLLVHDQVAKFNGSVSAEHGLGTLRRDEAARYKSKVEMDMMRAIKQALDPLGIMNPNKVLAI